MRPLWQAFIVLLALIGLTNMVGGLFNIHDAGTFGFDQPASLHGTSFIVRAVAPRSPAAAANVRAGDTLSYRPNLANRIIAFATVPGDTMALNDGMRTVTLTAVRDESPVPWALIALIDIAKLAFISIALVIVWRRPDDSAARALALFLVCFGAAINFDYVLLPSIAARFLALSFEQLTFLAGALGALAFACRFPTAPSGGLRLAISRTILPFAIVGYLVTALSYLLTFGGANSLIARASGFLYVALYAAIIFATLAALTDSYRQAEREQRARMRWVIGTLALGFSGLILLFIGLLLTPQTRWIQYLGLTILAIPFGLGYVILRHRVIDIGFVINRAVVYTAVSVVVVGAFIVFEWLLGHIVEANSRASAIIELCAALVLGLSVRLIHTRVDRYVDDLFFRERHIAEAAIRRFAHETGLITDPDILIRRTVEVAERNARLLGAAFFARSGPRYIALHSTFPRTAPDLDENDPAVLDMRAWHDPVDLQGESAVPGIAAFPMMVRGQLAGFLACGEKTTHEALAPDEHDALRVLARDAGIALDSLRIARIKQELAYLTDDGALPPDVRLRLSALLDGDTAPQPAGASLRSIQ
ncbi:MAG: hypothetical protein JO322_11115 [Candidatus Eremiobacteraeota bacterium]|nr:hypothetical protein [Candidatus Eremiobacteraeota bacterium]